MQIGVVYPQNELGGDPAAVRRIGRAVEDLGFSHPFHDPFVMFAYLAGITERIGFVTGILILPQRQTVLVARQAADVDLLSGGRLRLAQASLSASCHHGDMPVRSSVTLRRMAA